MPRCPWGARTTSFAGQTGMVLCKPGSLRVISYNTVPSRLQKVRGNRPPAALSPRGQQETFCVVCLQFFFLTAQNQAQTVHLSSHLYSNQPPFPHSGVIYDQWLQQKLDTYLHLPEPDNGSQGTSGEAGSEHRTAGRGSVPCCAHPRAHPAGLPRAVEMTGWFFFKCLSNGKKHTAAPCWSLFSLCPVAN